MALWFASIAASTAVVGLITGGVMVVLGRREAAIAADPADETAYIMLAELFGSENNQAEENRVLDRYLKIRPQSIEFRKRRAGGASAPSPAAP